MEKARILVPTQFTSRDEETVLLWLIKITGTPSETQKPTRRRATIAYVRTEKDVNTTPTRRKLRLGVPEQLHI